MKVSTSSMSIVGFHASIARNTVAGVTFAAVIGFGVSN